MTKPYRTIQQAKEEARRRANIDGKLYVVVEDTGGYTVLREESMGCQRAVITIHPDWKK